MSPLEVFSAIIGAVGACAGAAWWFGSRHTHPEFVRREEMDGLRTLLHVQHKSILRELNQLREDLRP